MKILAAISLGLSFFFYSIASFSIRSGIAAYFFLLMFALLRNDRKVLYAPPGVLIFFSVVYLYVSLVSIFNDFQFLYFIKFNLLFFYFVLIFVFCGFYKVNQNRVDSAVRLYLAIHSLFFFVQLATFYFWGAPIDFNNFFREEYANTSYISKDLVHTFISIRGTGVFSEPSFYAMSVLPASAYILLKEGRFSIVNIIALVTVFLSFSVVALLALFMVFFWYFFINRVGFRNILFLFALLAAFVIASLDFINARIFESADYDALGSRLPIFYEFLHRGWVQTFFGSGFFYSRVEDIGVTNIRPYMARDLSFFVYVFYAAGLVGLLSILIILVSYFSSRKTMLIVASLLLFKFDVLSSSLFLLTFLFVFHQKIRNSRNLIK